MRKRKLIPKESHHWWPIGLSKNWKNSQYLINVIKPNGDTFCSSPKKIGCIKGGHNIILNEPSHLDQTFEQEFDHVDNDFNLIIEKLTYYIVQNKNIVKTEMLYFELEYDNSFLNQLCNCIISLIVRSPMTRNIPIELNHAIGTDNSKGELKLLSAVNIIGKQKQIEQRFNDKGKFVILYSENNEFIFGDGFYHNISMTTLRSSSNDDRILIPLTPNMAIAYVNPISCMKEPRLLALKANSKTVDAVNTLVQIYSKNYLFFKTKKPVLNKYFIENNHLEIEYDKALENLFNGIPGMF